LPGGERTSRTLHGTERLIRRGKTKNSLLAAAHPNESLHGKRKKQEPTAKKAKTPFLRRERQAT